MEKVVLELDKSHVHEEFMLDFAYGGEVFVEAQKQLRELRGNPNSFV